MAIFESVLGPEHRQVGLVCNNLGWALLADGKHVEAQRNFKRALAIQEKAFGPESPEVARTLNNLGQSKLARMVLLND